LCLSHLIYTVWPRLIHTCHAHDVILNAMSQHVRLETACGLPACVWLLLATTRSSTKVIRSIPISDAGGQCETKRLSLMRKRVVTTQYKKDDLLNCCISSSNISGYHERHGTIRARHGHSMLCVNRLLVLHVSFTSFEPCIAIHICNTNQQNAH